MPNKEGYAELRKAKEMLEEALSVVDGVLSSTGESDDEMEEADEMDNGSYSEGSEESEDSEGETSNDSKPSKKALSIVMKVKNRMKK